VAVNRTSETYAVADTFGEDFDVDARPTQATKPTAVGSGWDDAETLTTPSGDFPVDFKHSESIQVIKIIDGEGPFATYKMHFLQQKTEGKRSYICLNPKNEPGKDCPLCSLLKHRAEDKRAFTIINFSAEGGPQRQILTATPRLYKTLYASHHSPQGPLDKPYWALSRSGVKQTTAYHLNAIKARDLKEDWNIDEEAAEALVAATKSYDNSVIRETSYAEVLEIAESLS
jgi:hypothetical protein